MNAIRKRSSMFKAVLLIMIVAIGITLLFALVYHPAMVCIAGGLLAVCLLALFQKALWSLGQKAARSDDLDQPLSSNTESFSPSEHGLIVCPSADADGDVFMDGVALTFQGQQYRLRRALYQTSAFTVYELVDPMLLDQHCTLFVAVSQDQQLYSVNICEGDEAIHVCHGPVSLNAIL